MSRSLCTWILAVSFFLSLPAFATDSGIDGVNVDLYRPAMDGNGVLGVNSADTLDSGQMYLSFSADWAERHLLKVDLPAGDLVILQRMATGRFTGALGLNSWITGSVYVPVHFLLKGDNFVTTNNYTTSTLGDVGLSFKFRLLKETDRRPGLSVLLGNEFPTGNERKLTGSKHIVPSVQILASKKYKYVELMFNAGARFIAQDDILGVDFNDTLTYGLSASFPVYFLSPTLDFVTQIRGSFQPAGAKINTSPISYLAGIKKEFKNGIQLQAAGGGGLNNAIGNPRIRGMLSIGYSFPVWNRSEKMPVKTAEVVNVFFAKKNSALTTESIAWLDEALAKAPASAKPIQITLYRARTDSLQLMQKRQSRIKELLTAHGIEGQRIVVTMVDVPKIVPEGSLGKVSYGEIVIPLTTR